MANWGMIGMVGGVGQGLQEQGKFLAREEEQVRTMGLAKTMEEWRMRVQSDYQVATEARANAESDRRVARDATAAVAKDEREWENKKTRAPDARQMAVDDEKAKTQAKYDVDAANIDTVKAKARAEAEGKETDTDRDLRGAQAEAHRANAEYTRGAKSALAGSPGGAAGKMSEPDKLQYQSLVKGIENREKAISEARISGNWIDAKLTPEQKAEQTQVGRLKKQANDIAARYSGGDAAGKPAFVQQVEAQVRPGAAPANGGQNFVNDPSGKANPDRQMQMRAEYQQFQQALATAQPGESRQGLQEALDGMKREAQRLGFDITATASPATPATAKPVVAPASSATPAPSKTGTTAQDALSKLVEPGGMIGPVEALGREVDSVRGELKTITQPDKRPGLKAGPAAREEYAAKVQSLRSKLQGLEQRYAESVGGQPARVFPQP